MNDAEQLARTLWRSRPTPLEIEIAQRAIDAGWTPPPPTLAEAVAAYREALERRYLGTLAIERRRAMFDALDREADQ